MSAAARLLRLLVVGYRRGISPLLPPRCRFAPTCSAYALEALEVHGAARGAWLALRRVARCHPFHPGGHDPVPRSRRHSADARSVSDDGRAAPVPPSAAPLLAPVPRLGASS